jgi:gas vesicle protein
MEKEGRNMNRFISFLSGILSGAVVGASAAILLAPTSGKEMVGSIQNRADKVVDDLRTAVERERQRLEAELASLKRGEIQVS